jgi:hypothetical protein
MFGDDLTGVRRARHVTSRTGVWRVGDEGVAVRQSLTPPRLHREGFSFRRDEVGFWRRCGTDYERWLAAPPRGASVEKPFDVPAEESVELSGNLRGLAGLTVCEAGQNGQSEPLVRLAVSIWFGV